MLNLCCRNDIWIQLVIDSKYYLSHWCAVLTTSYRLFNVNIAFMEIQFEFRGWIWYVALCYQFLGQIKGEFTLAVNSRNFVRKFFDVKIANSLWGLWPLRMYFYYTSIGCILTGVILTNRRYLDKKYRSVFIAQYWLYLDKKFSI